jgi:nucleoside-diphosphate-sugar epimerase
MANKILVAGAGGFIGGHLVAELLHKGQKDIRAVDIKPFGEWYQRFPQVENVQLDLQLKDACERSVKNVETVYNLAADMGGMGFIELNRGLCMLSVLINTHLLMTARDAGVKRYFYASSACVYAADKQTDPDVTGLREADAYPAMPEDGYGWEKLFSERMCRHFMEDFKLTTRVARFHNVYGPQGTYDGGREKAPAAICRKVISAKLSGEQEIEIWGDGHQTRSFMFIDDCIKGIELIMHSGNVTFPINLGSAEKVSINQLVDMVEDIAGIKLKRRYKLDAPKGVNGRNSDNTVIKQSLGWEPDTSLRQGMEKTYAWIYNEMTKGK